MCRSWPGIASPPEHNTVPSKSRTAIVGIARYDQVACPLARLGVHPDESTQRHGAFALGGEVVRWETRLEHSTDGACGHRPQELAEGIVGRHKNVIAFVERVGAEQRQGHPRAVAVQGPHEIVVAPSFPQDPVVIACLQD